MGAHDLLVQDAAGPRSSAGPLSPPEPGSGSQRLLCCLCPAGPLREADPPPGLGTRVRRALLLLGAHLLLFFQSGSQTHSSPSLELPLISPSSRLAGPERRSLWSPQSAPRSPRSWTLCRLCIRRFQPPCYPRTAFSLHPRFLAVLFLHWGNCCVLMLSVIRVVVCSVQQY